MTTADLAHAAEDVRKHLELRSGAIAADTVARDGVIATIWHDRHSHALTDTVLRTLLAERDALAARLDTIGLLLPVLTATVSEPRWDAHSAELIVKAMEAHHAGSGDAARPAAAAPCVYYDQPGHTPDQKPDPAVWGRGPEGWPMCLPCAAIARSDAGTESSPR